MHCALDLVTVSGLDTRIVSDLITTGTLRDTPNHLNRDDNLNKSWLKDVNSGEGV